MSTKTSPARRVHAFLANAVSFKTTTSNTTLVLWAKIFDLVPRDHNGGVSHDVEDAVLDLLRDFREEVTAAERQVAGSEAESAMAPIASSARALTQTNVLHADWNSVMTSHLRQDTLSGWHWASLHLPTSETVASEDDLKQLAAELNDLEVAAAKPDVPVELRLFIEKQARAMRLAIRRYGLRGATALRDAISSSIGDAVQEHELIGAAARSSNLANREVVDKLQTVWASTAKAAGDEEKFTKAIIALTKVDVAVLPHIRGELLELEVQPIPGEQV